MADCKEDARKRPSVADSEALDTLPATYQDAFR
jgi:hypothetical protein